MSRNIFNTVQLPGVGSNTFDLSHTHVTTFGGGYLTPVALFETMPGDYFRFSAEVLVRTAALIAPVMHRVTLTLDAFYCPHRIVWPQWEDFITGTTALQVPFINNLSAISRGSLGAYLGLPQITDDDIDIIALPFAAYCKIWDDWYRDENLQDEIFDPLVAGFNVGYVDICTNPPLFRAWKPDYFTKSLPFAQKGPDVTIPLTTTNSALVEPVDSPVNPARWKVAPGTASPGAGTVTTQADGDSVSNGNTVWLDPMGTLKVDIQADAASINTLRQAIRLQEFLERDARGGTRMTETLYAHFGVKSSDSRLQRPEFLGRSVHNVIISEVLSTAQTLDLDDQSTPIGQLAGHAISAGASRPWKYYCEENGYIMVLASVLPEPIYSQGVPLHFQRRTRLDWPWPSFANLGERVVKTGELYATGTNLQAETTFGYLPIYAEMRYQPSRVSGEFLGTLDYWTLARKFDALPQLNEEFITCQPSDFANIFAVTQSNLHEQFYAHFHFNCKVSRKLPVFGTPSL